MIKGNTTETQRKTIFKYLQKNIATASMVSASTGVPQKNICRYKRDMEEAGQLAQLYKADCQVTGCKAWYLTTNPKRIPSVTHQTKLY